MSSDLNSIAELLRFPQSVRQFQLRNLEEFAVLRQMVLDLGAQVAQLQRQLPPLIMRRKEAAKHLGVSMRTVDRMIKEGSIRSIMSGKTVLCDMTSLKPADPAADTRRVVLGEKPAAEFAPTSTFTDGLILKSEDVTEIQNSVHDIFCGCRECSGG